MAKDAAREARLEELTDEEIERIEGVAFCAGGPPRALEERIADRAAGACARPKAAG